MSAALSHDGTYEALSEACRSVQQTQGRGASAPQPAIPHKRVSSPILIQARLHDGTYAPLIRRTYCRLWAGVLVAVSLQPVEEGLAGSFDLIGDPVYVCELEGGAVQLGDERHVAA